MFKKFLITICLAFSLMCGTGYADSVVLGWDANIDSIDGYMVYRSQTSGQYVFGDSSPNLMDVIPCTANDPVCTEYIGQLLEWETTYYWVVTAFLGPNSEYESGSSNEVTYTTSMAPIYPPNDPTGCIIKVIIPSE